MSIDNRSSAASGYDEAQGYAASLRQQADWIEESREGRVSIHQRIDLGDIDVDEMRAAADFIERIPTVAQAGREPVAYVPLSKSEWDKGEPIWREVFAAKWRDKDVWRGFDLMPLYVAPLPPSSAGSIEALIAKWRAEAAGHFGASNDDDCGAGTEEWCLHREANRIYSRCADELAALGEPQAVPEEMVPKRLLNGRDDFIVNKGLWSEFMSSLSRPHQPGFRS